MRDIQVLKRPYAVTFTKGNSIHPFEDASSLEFFSQKNDTSQILFASHSKKRPHALTWIRCFGGHILDMIELYVVQDTARLISQFKNEKVRPGVKPMLAFSGTAWDDPSRSEYALAKSIFIDFFRGAEVSEMDVEGLQLLLSFSVAEEGDVGYKPWIQMRCYKIITKKSGSKIPKIEVDEIGPRIDFKFGRNREADGDMLKEAMKRAKGTEVSLAEEGLLDVANKRVQAKSKKNIETDLVGDKMGRIHLGRQDLSKLQSRKMKGLKRRRDDDDTDGADILDMEDAISQGDDDDVNNSDEEDGGVELKRMRTN